MATHKHTNLTWTTSAVRSLQSSDTKAKNIIARNDCNERDCEHKIVCAKDTDTND